MQRIMIQTGRWCRVVLVGLLLAGVWPAAAVEHRLPIEEHILENGLRVLVLHRPGDHRVAAKIFTRMGPVNEVPGELGSAHFLEHLMFKGTPTLGTRDWAAEQPLRERIWATERAMIEEWNRARNALRERGVFHDYQHQASTPELDRLRGELAELDLQVMRLRDHGAMMRWYQAFGGTRLTATTEHEYMKFDINLPVERIEVFFRVEADRMANSVFREFEQERMILVEQRLGDLNRPYTRYHEALNDTQGRIHPVFWNEGYLPDFFQYTRHYEEALYREFFVANNTTLVFVGGVTLAQMIPLAEQYFGWMPRAPEPSRIKALEPVPEAERRMIWRSDTLRPRVELRHMIPGVGHPDRPHFDVLNLVAEQAVSKALANAGIEARVHGNFRIVHSDRFGVPASWNIEIDVDENSQLMDAEAVALNALAALAENPPDEDALREAQRRLRTEWYRTARDADALAFEIGHFQVMDHWQTLESYLNARESTVINDISRLLAQYVIPANRAVGIIRAEKAAGGAR
jgi:predicted Zn-dependent peptidase